MTETTSDWTLEGVCFCNQPVPPPPASLHGRPSQPGSSPGGGRAPAQDGAVPEVASPAASPSLTLSARGGGAWLGKRLGPQADHGAGRVPGAAGKPFWVQRKSRCPLTVPRRSLCRMARTV